MAILDDFIRESNAIEGVYDNQSIGDAREAYLYCTSNELLNIEVILKTHSMLMANQPVAPEHKGFFRKEAVFIGGREAPGAVGIPYLIQQWLETTNQAKSEKQIKLDHIEYERIHPFIDGNGRTGRIFMNFQRQKAGLPILVIRESEKQNYYKWFESLI